MIGSTRFSLALKKADREIKAERVSRTLAPRSRKNRKVVRSQFRSRRQEEGKRAPDLKSFSTWVQVPVNLRTSKSINFPIHSASCSTSRPTTTPLEFLKLYHHHISASHKSKRR